MTSDVFYKDQNNKVFENGNKQNQNQDQKQRQKSKELDIIKEIDQIVEEYNKDPNNHYKLRLKKALRRAWF